MVLKKAQHYMQPVA